MRDQYRLKLVGPDGIEWFSETLMMEEDSARAWIRTTLQSSFGTYLKRAERFDIPAQKWVLF